MSEQPDISVEFGRRLRRLRVARGMTQERLADAAGMDRTYIGPAEAGKHNPALKSIEKLAHALEVDFLALLSDEVLAQYLPDQPNTCD